MGSNSSKPDPKVLMSLRVPKGLHIAIADYAQRRGITITQITLDHYRSLLEQEDAQDAEQV